MAYIIYFLTVFPVGLAELIFAWKYDHRNVGTEVIDA